MSCFDESAIQLFDKQDWISLYDILDNRFKTNPEISNTIDVSELSFKILDELLDRTTINILENSKDEYVLVAKHLFKSLRNVMAFSTTNYKYVADSSDILLNSYKVLDALKTIDNPKCIDCIKMLLQFLINFIVNNPVSSTKVWLIFGTTIENLIGSKSYSYYASALTYNIFHKEPSLATKTTFEAVFDMYNESVNNEYLTFLLEDFVNNDILNCTYINYKTKHRILCLEMFQQILKTTEHSIITSDLITIISIEFKRKSDCILKTVVNYLNDIEPYEVGLLLDVLASISSDEISLKQLQIDKSLLINCVFLLKSIHSVGKASENNFTPIGKLSELNNPDSKSLNHPAFGFKAALIRTLGNLAWRNKVNQDEIRNLDCIPLLLDCCNMDARNPFIIQWVIFAIRNLCDGNLENQALIASMNKEGVVSSAALHEMGITLQGDKGNLIKIVPLDLKK